MDVKPERCLFYKIENERCCFVDMISPHMVESIVFTGGSSRTPVFKDKLRRIFPQTINAEEAAASGAVIASWNNQFYAALKETINAEEAAAIGAVIAAQHIPQLSDDCT